MENKEKLGQEPAFPIKHKELTTFGELESFKLGMSKRFYAACAAMQGILSNPNISDWVSSDNSLQRKEVAITAFSFADAILKQENE